MLPAQQPAIFVIISFVAVSAVGLCGEAWPGAGGGDPEETGTGQDGVAGGAEEEERPESFAVSLPAQHKQTTTTAAAAE